MGTALTTAENELPARNSLAQGASSQLQQLRHIPAHSHPLYRQLLWFTCCRSCIHKSTLRNAPIREWRNKTHAYYWNSNVCLQRNCLFPSWLPQCWRTLDVTRQRRLLCSTEADYIPTQQTLPNAATAAQCFSAEESRILATRGKMGDNRNFLRPYLKKAHKLFQVVWQTSPRWPVCCILAEKYYAANKPIWPTRGAT